MKKNNKKGFTSPGIGADSSSSESINEFKNKNYDESMEIVA